MIEVFQPPRPSSEWNNIPNMSPFCLKLETYLRMNNIPYVGKIGNPMRAPKGKLPYARIDGEWIGDSSFIIELLKKKHGDALDAHLSEEQKGIALAFRRMLEEHTFFCAASERWSDGPAWPHMKKFFTPLLPKFVGGFILDKLKRDFIGRTRAQGVGVHSAAEIESLAKSDVKAIANYLGNKQFFMGDKPSSVDATVFGFAANLLGVPWESELKSYANSFDNLKRYCERMHKLYWSQNP